MHGEPAKVNRAPSQPQKIAPLFHALHLARAISVNLFKIRVHNTHGGQLAPDVRWRQKLFAIKKNVVALNSGSALRIEEIRKRDMEAAQQSLKRDLQNIDLRYVNVNLIVRGRRDLPHKLHWQRNQLVQSSPQPDLIAIPGERQVPERR